MKIPKQIIIYERVPAGPLISVGEISKMYFEENTKNAPHEIPYINRLTYIDQNPISLKRGIIDPNITSKLQNIIHLRLPYFKNGPAQRAPIAVPAVVRD